MTTNGTYKEDTEVVVYGIYDIVWGGCDFEKTCILKDAFEIARKHWNTLDDAMKEKCKTGEEDIMCSYHSSLKIFKNIIVLDNTNEILLPNGTDKSIGNLGNGAIKITPVGPNIEVSVNQSQQLSY